MVFIIHIRLIQPDAGRILCHCHSTHTRLPRLLLKPQNYPKYPCLECPLHDAPCGDTAQRRAMSISRANRLTARTTRVALSLGSEAVKRTAIVATKAPALPSASSPYGNYSRAEKTRSLIPRVVAADIHVPFVQAGLYGPNTKARGG